MFVLEALAPGVPVGQPEHRAVPEFLEELGGGLLHRPEDAQHLAERLRELLLDAPRLKALGQAGRQAVLAGRNHRLMAERTAAVLVKIVQKSKTPPKSQAAQALSAVERA